MPAGVEGSILTLPLLVGRSSDIGRAPAAVLTEWLRVSVASSAVDETKECGLRSRFCRTRGRVDLVDDAVPDGWSLSRVCRFRIDLEERPASSERSKTGLKGSISVTGDGMGVPRSKFGGIRLKLLVNLFRGGVANLLAMAEARRDSSAVNR